MDLDFTKLIILKYPEYDKERYYPKLGEVWTLRDNQTKVLIIDYLDFRKVKCIVIKTGFFFKKGEVLEIENSDFPYIDKEKDYKSEELKSNTKGKIFYEPGDIIDIKEHSLTGVVLRNDSYYVYQVFITSPGIHKNSIKCIEKQYKEYQNFTK